jgi:hypothetical protein
MIDVIFGSSQSSKKLGRIFSKIMEQAGEPRRPGNAETLSKYTGEICRRD